VAHDGGLALNDATRAFELADMGLTTSFVAQQLALFGVCLLELNTLGLGCLTECVFSRLQHLTAGGVGNGFS